VYPPGLVVPEECIKVEDIATLLFRQDSPYITQLWEGNSFINAAFPSESGVMMIALLCNLRIFTPLSLVKNMPKKGVHPVNPESSVLTIQSPVCLPLGHLAH